jgi:SpoVK/Ycf46/Vps4 family AAA+-type ATPase
VTQSIYFESETALPDARLSAKERTLLGFDNRYARIRDQIGLLLNIGQLPAWSKKYYGRQVLAICNSVAEQYPLIVFHGDVGTGKTATAECVANRWVNEAKVDDSSLYKLSNRVRGTGKVGEMGTFIADAFKKVVASAGKHRRAILIIDEGDSIASNRSQDQSHHEDKVAVNTLIQCVDDLRNHDGRVIVFLCTNRLSVLDAAIRRRAAIVEEFRRPDAAERKLLFAMDLKGLSFSDGQIGALVAATGAAGASPVWTYSDIRTRLYPAALALAFPDKPLHFDHFRTAITGMTPSPVLEDK